MSVSVWSSRGQVLPAASLLNIVDVELVSESIKYALKVSCARIDPQLFGRAWGRELPVSRLAGEIRPPLSLSHLPGSVVGGGAGKAGDAAS